MKNKNNIKKRPNGIGGTDANKLVHDDTWLELYDLKVGNTEPADLSDVLPVRIGTITEDLNREWFTKEMDLRVTQETQLWYNKYIYGNLDGLVVAGMEGEDVPLAVFEAKHSGQFMDTPKQHINLIDRYYPQLQHYMMCAKLNKAYLSIFFGNRTHKIFTIEEDRKFQSLLLKAYKVFWIAVNTKRPIDTNWRELHDITDEPITVSK
jgi:predicted phage-related endonuclease|tara:strand:+ start:1049 stop:1669 length:621 start_codon:yes stop_codon:yes gene_type:complete